jgi:phosphatidate cytidylyltransferase
MGKRALFGGIYALVLIGTFGYSEFGPYLLAVFTTLLLNEVARILDVQSRLPLLTFTTIALVLGFFFGWGGPIELISSTLFIGILLALSLLRSHRPAHEMRRGLFALAYIWLPMAYLIQIAEDFPWLILFIFSMIWSSDTFAYLAGRQFGKRPLAPKLSPKKTIEGFIGGIIGTLIVGVVVNHYIGWTSAAAALSLALTVAITAPFGDLVASSLKREADIKDSGVFLPGHGGALDRLDSFITAAPVAALVYHYIQLI